MECKEHNWSPPNRQHATTRCPFCTIATLQEKVKELEEVCKDRNFQITKLQVEKEQAEAELSNKSHTATRLHTRAEALQERLRVEQSCNRCGEYHGKEACADVASMEVILTAVRKTVEWHKVRVDIRGKTMICECRLCHTLAEFDALKEVK